MIVEQRCSCCLNDKGKLLYNNLTSVYSNQPWSLVECLECSNIFTSPKPSDELLSKIYTEKYFYHVHKLAIDEKKFRSKSFAKFIRNIVPHNKENKLLEIGCMYGYLLEELKYNFSVKGIDIGKEAIEFCRSKGLDVTEVSIEDFLNGSSEKFDIIVLSHVFEHLLDPEQILDKLRSLLSPNGKIILSVPNSESTMRKLFGRYWGWWQVPVHINHFNLASLKRLVERKNLKLETVRFKGGDSLMLLLNLVNLFHFRSDQNEPGIFQKFIIRIFTTCFRYRYYTGNEELTIVIG